ncbi:MAG: Mrp/NBP35 family ATP-binding protein [bacterium]|jgi:ATP-binding protein involved in chromosome partitioning
MPQPKITEEQVLAALAKVIDPDLHRDIVSLGFIENLQISGNNDVSLTIVLTTPACPMKDRMKNEAMEHLRAIPGIGRIEITMDAKVVKRDAKITPQNLLPQVGNSLAIASGKGGVGKSTVAANMAVALAKDGATVGLLDADIYGPSIPIMMGVQGHRPRISSEKKILPIEVFGVKLMSIGFLIDPDQAVIWRGPMVGAAVKQFLSDVEWGELDYLVIDLPPGTGDAQLTLVQNLEVTGAVIVTTPQKVAHSVAAKGISLFRKMNVPVLGIIENMSYYVCPDCGKEDDIFGRGGGREIAEYHDVPFLGEIPINGTLRKASDEGLPEVARDPDSAISSSFFEVSRNLAANVSKHLFESGGAAAR